MKSKFKKIFLSLAFVSFISFIGCSPKVDTVTPNDTYGVTMENSFEGYYSLWQFDSICNVDKIDRDLSKWYFIPFRDYETKENVSQYMYLKELGQYEIIYRLQKIDDNRYKITKRITK